MKIHSPSRSSLLVCSVFIYIIGMFTAVLTDIVFDWDLDGGLVSTTAIWPAAIFTFGYYIFFTVYTTDTAVYQKQADGIFRSKLIELKKDDLKVISSDWRWLALTDSNGSKAIVISEHFLSKDKYIELLDELEIRT